MSPPSSLTTGQLLGGPCMGFQGSGYPARLHRILVPYRSAASQQRERLEARDAESPGRRYPGEEHAKNREKSTKRNEGPHGRR
jgi:hypothetical protein